MPEVENKTAIYCKSDCEFSQNEQRICSLYEIQMSQLEEGSPKLACSQYVKAMNRLVDERNTRSADIERARSTELKKSYANRLRGAGWK